MARSHVVAWSHDAKRNVMGKAHINLIQDTRLYKVDFAGVVVTELTTNVILSQCIPTVMQIEMSVYS